MRQELENPFVYSTPDQIIEPQKVLNLFVDVYKDFYLIETPGNTFIHGPRGSGKSMMFRMMMPDCQLLKTKKKLNKLPYLSIYVPIKDTSLNITELVYLEGRHGENTFNEHLLCLYIATSILANLSKLQLTSFKKKTEILNFYNDVFLKRLEIAGFSSLESMAVSKQLSEQEIFSKGVKVLEELSERFVTYLSKMTLKAENIPYDGPLCMYRNFLFPLIEAVYGLSFLPKHPIYILIDDADLLNVHQTRILNSWVSFRTTSKVCYKISTQLNYKTYNTSNSYNKVDSPHDYHEINLTDIFTSNKGDSYRDNLKAIIEKRLRYLGKLNKVSAEAFLPSNAKQEDAVLAISKALSKAGHNNDYVYRNARPDYMVSLANDYTYSYAGFEQLSHLSSGIIRNFIELCSRMYEKAYRDKGTSINKITTIPVGVQDKVIMEFSNWFMQQLEKPIDDQAPNSELAMNYVKLKLLINSIGKAFRMYLQSNHSERRKFSFYFEGEPDEALKKVLKLGVSEGFLHYSTQGSKTGLGRAHKYVLNRMLSPIFKLDPFAFSGYLHLPVDKISLATINENAFLEYIRKRIKNKKSESEDQLPLEFNS